MSAKRTTPRAAILLRLEPEELEAIDKARGEAKRVAWIVAQLMKVVQDT